jgi:transcriptional regulator with XRE-family HTH domain
VTETRPVEEWERSHLTALGQLLREYRKDAHLTQKELAARSGLSEDTIYAYERALCRCRRSTIIRLAKVLAAAHPAVGPAWRVSLALDQALGPIRVPESTRLFDIERRRDRKARRHLRRQDHLERGSVAQRKAARAMVELERVTDQLAGSEQELAWVERERAADRAELERRKAEIRRLRERIEDRETARHRPMIEREPIPARLDAAERREGGGPAPAPATPAGLERLPTPGRIRCRKCGALIEERRQICSQCGRNPRP